MVFDKWIRDENITENIDVTSMSLDWREYTFTFISYYTLDIYLTKPGSNQYNPSQGLQVLLAQKHPLAKPRLWLTSFTRAKKVCKGCVSFRF